MLLDNEWHFLFWKSLDMYNAASPAIPTDNCEASVVRSTLPAHVLCLSEPVGRVAQNMSKKACETNRKRSMSVGIAVDSSIA